MAKPIPIRVMQKVIPVIHINQANVANVFVRKNMCQYAAMEEHIQIDVWPVVKKNVKNPTK